MPELKITNEDCMKLMKRYPDKYFELAIVDPPYGIFGKSGNPNFRKEKRDKIGKWDEKIPDQTYFNELKRVSKNQIIWGGNYFNLPATRCYIIWDKIQPEQFSLAMCEFAWTSFNDLAKIYRQRVVNADITRIHPTQKPVALYKWLLKNYAQEGDKILDTHLGSGSSAIACHYMGFDLTACELDKEYFDKAMERITNQTRQQTLTF